MKPLGATDPAAVGTYRLLGVLGGGGMGRVYLGESRSGRRVAIKVIRSELAEDLTFRRRFSREVAAIQAVSPLFTAPVVEFDTDAEAPWVATTYIEGPTLGELVSEGWHDATAATRTAPAGPLASGAVLTLAAGLADAVASVHRAGLVHRDIKPSNVIINDLGPHVIDFGIALAQDAAAITTSLLLGTPSYIAPEIIQGGDPSPASDVFSIGSTLVFAASGRHLVNEGTMHAQILRMTMGRFDLSAVPRELRPLIVRCLSPRPKDRPTADELARIIVASGAAAPVPGWYTRPDPAPPVAVPPLPITLAGRRSLSRRAVVIGGVAAAAVVGTGLGVAAALTRRTESQAAAPVGPTVPPPPAPEPRHPGGVLWLARSDVDPVAASTGARVNASRIVVLDRTIVAANAGRVLAVDPTGASRWVRPLPTGLITLYRWGDGVLATDARTAWYLDSGGTERFAVAVADRELAAAQEEGQSQPAPEIGPVAVADDRAYFGLGTAVIALDRAGTQLWRIPRAGSSPIGAPLAAGGNWLVTHDPLGVVAGRAQVRVGLRAAADGLRRWYQDYAPTPFQPPAGPPGGGLAGGQPGGPSGSGPAGYDDSWDAVESAVGPAQVVLRDAQEVRVFGLSDGKSLWAKASPTPVTSVTLLGDTVIVTADRISAYAVLTGALRWEIDLRGARVAVTPDGRSVIVADGRVITALDPGGQQVWRTAMPAEAAGAAIDQITATDHEAYLTLKARGDRAAPLDVDVIAVALD